MSEHTAPAEVAEDLGQLRDAFPTWSIWTSDVGAFYATRRGPALSAQAQEMGCASTLGADDSDTLRGLLDAQAALGAAPGETADAGSELEGLR